MSVRRQPRGATRPRYPRQILGARGLREPGRGPRRKEEEKRKKGKGKEERKKGKKGKKKKRGRGRKSKTLKMNVLLMA